MKKITMIVGAAVASFFAATVYADQSTGTVDMQRVLSSAPQMKKINTALQQQFSKRKDSILAQAQTLQSDMQNYTKNKSVLTGAKLTDLQGKIAGEEGNLRSEQARYEQDLGTAQNKAMSGFLIQLQQVVATVATKQKISVVMPKNTLLYADPKLDITDSVIAALK